MPRPRLRHSRIPLHRRISPVLVGAELAPPAIVTTRVASATPTSDHAEVAPASLPASGDPKTIHKHQNARGPPISDHDRRFTRQTRQLPPAGKSAPQRTKSEVRYSISWRLELTPPLCFQALNPISNFGPVAITNFHSKIVTISSCVTIDRRVRRSPGPAVN